MFWFRLNLIQYAMHTFKTNLLEYVGKSPNQVFNRLKKFKQSLNPSFFIYMNS